MIEESNQRYVDNGSLHKYRTELPNILLDIGLDPLEIVVYIHMKRIAGDHGGCFCSNKTLSEKCKISKAKLKEIKSCLAKKGLIKITQRVDEKKCYGTSVVEIIDIWEENMDHFKQKAIQKEEGGVGHHMAGGRPPGGPKEEPTFKKEPSSSLRSEEDQPLPFTSRKRGPAFSKSKPREKGTSPRAKGTNPKAKGTNPQEEKRKAAFEVIEPIHRRYEQWRESLNDASLLDLGWIKLTKDSFYFCKGELSKRYKLQVESLLTVLRDKCRVPVDLLTKWNENKKPLIS